MTSSTSQPKENGDRKLPDEAIREEQRDPDDQQGQDHSRLVPDDEMSDPARSPADSEE